MQILTANFRKRIDGALEKARETNESELRELTGLELIRLMLGTLLSATADSVIGEELEQSNLKKNIHHRLKGFTSVAIYFSSCASSPHK
jgi:hypothetical protein